jgi:hypothetical protein
VTVGVAQGDNYNIFNQQMIQLGIRMRSPRRSVD